MKESLSWIGSIAIIAGFFWVQVQIDQLSKGFFHAVLLLLTLIGEAYLIWLWNSQNI